MEIGERIRQLRKSKHMGVADLASEVGLEPDDLTSVESGERQLSHAEITALAKVLEVETDDLFTDEESVGNSVLIPTDKLNQLLEQMKD